MALDSRMWALAGAALLALSVASGCARWIGADEITLADGSAGAPGASEMPCERQSDCSGLRVCLNGRCRALRNDGPDYAAAPGRCKLVLGAEALLDEGVEPFLLGVFTAFPPAAPETWPSTRNYEFALREFSRRGGIPVAGESRMPVAVACDGAADVDRSFDHLRSLGITTVIAGLDSALDLKRNMERLNRDRPSMFAINPFASTLQSFGVQGLLWSMLGTPTEIARVYPPLIQRVSAHLRATRGLDRPLRVAMLQGDDAGSSDMAGYVDARIAESFAQYQRYSLKDPDEDIHRSYADAQIGLARFVPDIVISVAGDSFVRELLRPLETNWEHLPDAPAKPFYVLAPHQAADPEFLSLLEERPDLAKRIVGVNAAGATDRRLYDRYFAALTAAYPTADDLGSTENFYDATYFLLYAVSAASTPQPLAVRAGMKRLIAGPSLDIGESNIERVLQTLSEPTNSISLNGTLGPPDFDPETGARSAPGSVWCVASSDAGFEYHYDVLRLDSDDELSGTFDCFPFP